MGRGSQALKIAPDTNVLVRAVVRDDLEQEKLASALLRESEAIVLSLATLCELVWVLDRVYGFRRPALAAALEALVGANNVVVNRATVEAGLETLRAGGDFADGVIAFEGESLGGEMFVSFDRKAVAVLRKQGRQCSLLEA